MFTKYYIKHSKNCPKTLSTFSKWRDFAQSVSHWPHETFFLNRMLLRLMDKLWLREGLDLKMVTFACVPTGHRHGMVELVTEAKTLREIQVTIL